jgi:hypothetical protein
MLDLRQICCGFAQLCAAKAKKSMNNTHEGSLEYAKPEGDQVQGLLVERMWSIDAKAVHYSFSD